MNDFGKQFICIYFIAHDKKNTSWLPLPRTIQSLSTINTEKLLL